MRSALLALAALATTGSCDRVRVGVGHPGDKDRVEGWVLQDFPKADWPLIERMVDAVAEELPLLVAGDDGAFMSKVTLVMNPPAPKPPRKTQGGGNGPQGPGGAADGV